MSKKHKCEIDYDKVKIIHTMSDGMVRAFVKGYETPYNDITAAAYGLLAKWNFRKQSGQKQARERRCL